MKGLKKMKRNVPNLEKELRDYELCPITKKCNPDETELENYCVINYQNCPKYIQYENGCYDAEKDLWNTTRLIELEKDHEWEKWLKKIRRKK